MAGQLLTDILPAMRERLREGALPFLFHKSPWLAVQRVCKNTETFRITKTVNGADFRAPIAFGPPGTFGAWNPDGGAMGLGSGFTINQFLQSYFPIKMAFQISDAARYGSATAEQGVLNAWTRTMEEGLPNAAENEDNAWHNLGGSDGQIAVATAYTATDPAHPGSGGTYTFDPGVGTRLLIPGQRVEIINGATYKTGQTGVSPDALPFVVPGTIAADARTCQISSTIELTGGNVPAAGDVLYFQGATPSGTPTWLQGLRYVNSTSTSGTYLGLSRTTYPFIKSSAITSGGVLTADMVFALRNLIANIIGTRADQLNLIGLASTHQIAIMNKSVQNMQVYYRSQVTEKQIDPLPAVTTEGGVLFGGVTHYEDFKQDSTRIDYCCPDDWGRVYLNDKPGMDFYRSLDGREFFPLYSTSNGTPSAAALFYLVGTVNYYNLRPPASGLLTNLTPPSTLYTY